MACNAIVYQPASISEENMLKRVRLTPDVQKGLGLYVKVAFPQATDVEPFETGVSFYLSGSAFGRRLVTVAIYNGVVTAEVFPSDPELTTLAAKQITAFLRQVGGVQLQTEIAKSVARLARVTKAQPAANGTLVLSLEL